MTFFTNSILVDLVGFATAIVAMVYAYYLWSFQYWKRKNVPCLEPSIPWGNFESPRKRTCFIGDTVRNLYQVAKSKGWKYCGMYTMAKPSFLVLDLDLVKLVMTKDFHNFVDRGMYTNERDDPLSCHLFSISGNKWRNLRTKLTPTFTSGKMKGMFNTLLECGSALEEYIEVHIDKNNEAVDIKEVLGKFSTDVIGSCAFGLDCNSFENENSPFRTYGRRVFERTKWDVFQQAFSMNFPEIAQLFKMRAVPKDVSDFFMKVVADTVEYREKNNYTRNDFLQLLIEIKNNKETHAEHKGDGKTLTMSEVAAQSFVFFLAGFETSSSTMAFALYELAVHQDLQDRVREEIRRVLAKHEGKVTYDSLSELKYMKQVIDETLRMYAPVPFLTRMSAEDYKVPGEDVVIEKNTRIIIPVRGIHYDEEYYENPTVFNPERFSDENKAARHPYAHIPFGEGPRICIGERFGIMQTKVGLTTILRNFKVTLNKKTKVPLEYSVTAIIPSVRDGIWLNIEKV